MNSPLGSAAVWNRFGPSLFMTHDPRGRSRKDRIMRIANTMLATTAAVALLAMAPLPAAAGSVGTPLKSGVTTARADELSARRRHCRHRWRHHRRATGPQLLPAAILSVWRLWLLRRPLWLRIRSVQLLRPLLTRVVPGVGMLWLEVRRRLIAAVHQSPSAIRACTA